MTIEQLELDPHALLAQLREREPVAWVPAIDGWLVTRRDLSLRVMRETHAFTVDDPRFSTAQVVGPSMLTLEGVEHDRHRAPFAPMFRRDAVRERFAHLVTVEVERLIDTFEPEGAAELRRGFAGPLSAAVITRVLGLAETDVAAVLGWYDAIVAAVDGVTAGGPVTAEGRTAFAELRAALEPALGPDAVSDAAVLLFGGIETTEGMIANAVLHLLSYPDQLALVRADAALLPGAIEESLRLEPAAAVVDRYATADVELGGTRIGGGDLVRVSVTAANRDPDEFPDPDRFDVCRPNARHHLAFAHGPHVCLGMHLARLEARTAVGRLLDRLPGLRLDPRHPSAPHGFVFRKPPELRVLWDRSSLDAPRSARQSASRTSTSTGQRTAR